MIRVRVRDRQKNTVEELSLGEGTYTIGRAPENTIALKDMSVSRWHAELIVKGNTCIIRDKESASGVLVGTSKVAEAEVHEEEAIHIGDMTLEIQWTKGRFSRLVPLLLVAGVAIGICLIVLWQKFFPGDSSPIVSYASLPMRHVEAVLLQRRSFYSYWEGTGEIEFRQVPVNIVFSVPIKEVPIAPWQEVRKDEVLITLDGEFLRQKVEEIRASVTKEEEMEGLYKKKLKELAPRGEDKIESVDKKIQYVEAQIEYAQHKSRKEAFARQLAEIEQIKPEIRAPVTGTVAQINEGENPFLILLDRSVGYAVTFVSETDVKKIQRGQRVEIFSEPSKTIVWGSVDDIAPSIRASDKTIEVKIKLRGLYLFSVPAKHQSDLSNGTISEELRKSFAEHDHSLLENAIVRNGGECRIHNGTRGNYLLVRTENALDVYKTEEDMGRGLRHGSPVRIKVLLGESLDAPAVPKQAVLPPRENPYLYIVGDLKTQEGKTVGKARKVSVQLGYSDEKFYELDPSVPIHGETWIIVKGHLTISDGDPVEIVTH